MGAGDDHPLVRNAHGRMERRAGVGGAHPRPAVELSPIRCIHRHHEPDHHPDHGRAAPDRH